MAIDTHIKFDGIEGESTSRDHKGEIRILSWSWGLTAGGGPSGTAAGGGPSGTAAGGGPSGSAAGRAVPHDLVFTHAYDKASPLLAKAAASGKHVPTVVLAARKSGEGQKDFLKITMKEVFITSVHVNDDGSGPTEQVSIRYEAIDFAYRPQTAKGGVGTPVQFGWNTRTGKVT